MPLTRKLTILGFELSCRIRKYTSDTTTSLLDTSSVCILVKSIEFNPCDVVKDLTKFELVIEDSDDVPVWYVIYIASDNVIKMAVFYQQSLGDTVNLCIFWRALKKFKFVFHMHYFYADCRIYIASDIVIKMAGLCQQSLGDTINLFLCWKAFKKIKVYIHTHYS